MRLYTQAHTLEIISYTYCMFEGATYMPHFREAGPVKKLEGLKKQMINRLEDRNHSDTV